MARPSSNQRGTWWPATASVSATCVSSCRRSSGQIGRVPRLRGLQGQQNQVQRRIRDARCVRRRRARSRGASSVICSGVLRDADDHAVERRLAEVLRESRAEVVGLAQERVAAIADARRELEREPAVLEPLEVRTGGAEASPRPAARRRSRPAGGRSAAVSSAMRAPATRARASAATRTRRKPGEPAPFHQCGTCTSRWIAEGLLSRVAR